MWPPSRSGSATARKIAAKHYLQVTDEHSSEAAECGAKIRRKMRRKETSRQQSRGAIEHGPAENEHKPLQNKGFVRK